MSATLTILPAEWAPQRAVMLTWPHVDSDWQDNLSAVETVFIEIVRHISASEALIITCRDDRHKKEVRQKFEQAHISDKHVSFFIHPSNDSWARDHGPISIFKNGQPCLLDFEFNGWGGKYPAEKDNRLNRALHKQGAFGDTPLVSLPFVLEGGSIDSDGQGSILATTACLLSATRNPLLDKATIENSLMQYLGIDRVLWLQHGHLRGDDTDSHIDMLARFCNATTIAYSCCDDENDEHFVSLQAMKQELVSFLTPSGKAYQLVPLPIPKAIFNSQHQRLPASYTNFLITNQTVLVPQYNDPADKMARINLQDCFPDREIIGIDCLPIIQQYGSLHCLTMQLAKTAG